MSTACELLLARADDDRPALLFEDRRWSYRQLVDEGRRRAAFHSQFQTRFPDAGRPPHIGILLDNSPEYMFWLTAAALSGSVLVGINSTYRGEPLGQLISHTDCDVVVTSKAITSHCSRASTRSFPRPTDRGRRRRVPRRGGRHRSRRRRGRSVTTTCSSSSSPQVRPGCRRPCAARKAGSPAPGRTSRPWPMSDRRRTSSTAPSRSSTPLLCSRAGPGRWPRPHPSRPAGGSLRRRRSPTSGDTGPRCSLTPARC